MVICLHNKEFPWWHCHSVTFLWGLRKCINYCYTKENYQWSLFCSSSILHKLGRWMWITRLTWEHWSAVVIVFFDSNLSTVVLIQARPLLEEKNIDILADARLDGEFDVDELKSLMLSAALCIRHSAQRRPRMNTVSYSFTLGNVSTAYLTRGNTTLYVVNLMQLDYLQLTIVVLS